MRRKVLSILLAIAVCISMIGITAPEANAATGSAYNYSSEKALEYAAANWDIDPYDVDCIAFVKACVKAGGGPSVSGGIKSYVSTMVDKGYAEFTQLKCIKTSFNKTLYYVNVKDNQGTIAPGDVGVYVCPKCGRYWHVVLIAPYDTSGKYSGYFRFYAHNNPKNNAVLYRHGHNKTYCTNEPDNTQLWVLHFKSAENGYDKDGKKLTTVTAAPSNNSSSSSSSSSSSGSSTTATTGFKSFKVTAATKVNKRLGPSTSYKKSKTLKKGQTVTIVDEKNGWGKLKTSGKWISLRLTNISEGYTVSITSSNLNMRTGPSSKYKSKGYIKQGTYVVSKIDGSWCKIKSKGLWVSRKYVTRQ